MSAEGSIDKTAFEIFARLAPDVRLDAQTSEREQQTRAIRMRIEPAFGATQARIGIGFAEFAVGANERFRPRFAQRAFDFVERGQHHAERGGAARVGVDRFGQAALRAREAGPQRVELDAVRRCEQRGRDDARLQRFVRGFGQLSAAAERRECIERRGMIAAQQRGFGEQALRARRERRGRLRGLEQIERGIGLALFDQETRAQCERGSGFGFGGFVERCVRARGFAARHARRARRRAARARADRFDATRVRDRASLCRSGLPRAR